MQTKGPAFQNAIFWVWVLILSSSPLYAAELTPPLDRLIKNGGFITTIGDSVLDAHKEDELFIPASTIKIATALTAIKVLGPSYRFKTDFFLEGNSNLVIRGNGDPFLTSEYIRL